MKLLHLHIVLFLITGCSEFQSQKENSPLQPIDCHSSIEFGDIFICLPEIEGMTECFSDPLIKIIKPQINTPENQILGLYLQNGRYPIVRGNREISINEEYIQIFAPISSMYLNVSKSDLNKATSEILERAIKSTWNDIKIKINQPGNVISIDRPTVIDEYFEREDAKTLLMISTISSNEGDQYVRLMAINFISIKSRLIVLAYYVNLEREDSYNQIKKKNSEIVSRFHSVNNHSNSVLAQYQEVNDSLRYNAAKDMRGFTSDFIIGETTVSIKENLNRRFSEDPRYVVRSTFPNLFGNNPGNFPNSIQSDQKSPAIAQTVQDSKYQNITTIFNFKNEWDKAENYKIESSCPDFRVLYMSRYYIEDLEINSLSLVFFRDTLVQIYFSGDEKVVEGFRYKYGEGSVAQETIASEGEIPQDRKVVNIKTLIWENEEIIASSVYVDKRNSLTNPFPKINSYFIIESKSNWKLEVERCEEDIHEKNENELRKQTKELFDKF